MANLLQSLYLASLASGLLTIFHWTRSRSAAGAERLSRQRRFRGWFIATMLFSALAAVLYLGLAARA